MKIEVGKKYKDGSGNIVHIFAKHPKGHYLGIYNVIDYKYTDEGVRYDTKSTCFNLISEYTEPDKLSGYIIIADMVLGGREAYFCDNKEELEQEKLNILSIGFSSIPPRYNKIIGVIDLSQFNVGEGL